ncbi:hypothetical protein HMPREF1254_0409 [Prevotella sp. BV3P1]|uniref:hypothetical protein n=1 Tax=Hoylesella buccalis TaxID=28127 RepID=UPI0003B7F11C|nr:hypothetical protein [Hoylesella buccalis]ERT56572.1 hypothetical protein HMPREF1254_0409 [Prevotella sp. BV3P1]
MKIYFHLFDYYSFISFLNLNSNQKAKCLKQKIHFLHIKALLYDADWVAKACKLDGKSMLIAGLFHVNWLSNDNFKALNA